MNKIIGFIVLIVVITLAIYFIKHTNSSLILGINTSFPPFEYLDAEHGGEVLGFDIELAKIIAKDYGKNLEIKIMGFLEILPAIQKKDIDMGMSTFTITEERKKIVDFSIPYYETYQVVLVLKDKEAFSSTNEKEALTGKRLSSRNATTGIDIAKELTTSDNVIEYSTWPLAIKALLSNNVDAVFIDKDTAEVFAEQSDRIRILNTQFETEYYGVAVQKGNKKLLNSINKTIEQLKSSGQYDKLVEDYILNYPNTYYQ